MSPPSAAPAAVGRLETGPGRLSVWNTPRVVDADWVLSQPPDAVRARLVDPKTGLLKLAPVSTSDQLFVVLGSTLVAGSFFWLPLALYWIYRRHCTTPKRKLLFLFVLLAILLSLVFTKPSQRVARARGFWDRFLRYHSSTVLLEEAHKYPPPPPESGDAAQPGRMVLILPHGIYPFAQAFSLIGGLRDLFGPMRAAVASAALWAPVFGHLLRFVGAVPADAKTMRGLLEKGESVMLTPGGVAEMFTVSHEREATVIQNRKGFVRVALEAGAALVPVYAFGNTQLWRILPASKWLEPVSRAVKAGVILFRGRWGLPVPFREPLMYAVGREIQLKRTPNPTKEEVDAAHALFSAEVARLFEQYRGAYGWDNKPLDLL